MSQPKWVLPLSLATVLLLVGAGSPLPEADRYTWETVAADGGPGLEPVAATRFDRDRDGNPDLAIAYGGDGRGALVWIPIHASQLGAPEPPLELPFEPTAMVAGDLDADGREELTLAVTGTPVLAVVAVAADGEVGAPTFHPLPGVAQRLALEDRPRRDGLPELVVDLDDHRLVAGGPRGALAGLLSPRLEALPEAATEASLRDGVRLLLATRIDADASPELVVAAPDGSVRVGTLIRATVVVDTTDDSVDFGGAQQVADLPGPDGKTTLREAIIAANNSAGPHLIQFNIPQSGNDFHDNAWWFSPSDGNLGPLPAITTWGVTVDGGSQAANQGDTNPNGPELVLDGSGLLVNGDGFQLAPYCTLIDFVVLDFQAGGSGVLLLDADNAVVKGCYVGTSPDGTSPAGNQQGIMIRDGTTGALIGGTGTHGSSPEVPDGNMVSGNLGWGLWVFSADCDDTLIQGNRVGLSTGGLSAIPNQHGIGISGGARTTIGGTASGARNLVSGNSGNGIHLTQLEATETLIQGNWIGLDANGSGLGNGYTGLTIGGGATSTTVGGTTPSAANVVSGNLGFGVRIDVPGTSGTLLLGNRIGTDPTGIAAVPNAAHGVIVLGGVSNNRIGGSDPGARNLISGNGGDGIRIQDTGTDGTVVQGNWIGLDASGTQPLPNLSGISISLGATGTIVGGTDQGAHNLISGNADYGVGIGDPGTDGTVVRGNWIGLDASGTASVPNLGNGVKVINSATNTSIGGDGPGEGNVIAGNNDGVQAWGAGTTGLVIQGNWIGLDASGDNALGNGANGIAMFAAFDAGPVSGALISGNVISGHSLSGVSLANGCHDNLIDGNFIGTDAGGSEARPNQVGVVIQDSSYNDLDGNLIGYSTNAGVSISGASLGNTLSRTHMSSNGGLGIDLGDDGVTANDVGDDDEGPNRLVNYPVLSSATNPCGTSTTVVSGTVDTASPQLGTVELFASVVPDPTGFGEGGSFIGTATPALDGTFSATLPALTLGHHVTATYTDAAGNTSEFSAGVQVLGTPFNPESLHADLAAGPSVDLGWVDASTDESSFRLERRAAGGSFAFLTALPADSTSYHDPGPLTAGTTYYYRVRAQASGCVSAWSNVASVTVPGATSAFCRTQLTNHHVAANPSLEHASGGDFGAAWREVEGNRASIVYARLDATGAIVSGPVVAAGGAGQAGGQVLAWDGAAWGMAWLEQLGDRWGLFFRRLDLDGMPLGPPVKVSEEAGRPETTNVMRPGLEWDGSGWGLAWVDSRSATRAVYYAHLDPSGAKTTADVLVSDSPAAVGEPTLEFTGAGHSVTWLDYRYGNGQVWLRRIGLDGSPLAPSLQVTSEGVASWFQDTEWSGSELGLTWSDGREGDYRVYFRRLAADGTPLSPETLIQDVAPPPDGYSGGNDLTLRFADDRWVVSADGGYETTSGVEILLMFADLTGAKLGPDVFASSLADGRSSDFPGLAWGDGTLLATWHDTADQGTLQVHAQAMDSAGAPTAPRRVLTATGGPGPGTYGWPSVAFTGTRYAVAWPDNRADAGGIDLYLRLTDGDGQPVTGEIQVADPFPAHAGWERVGLAFSGETLAVAWSDADGNVWLSLFSPGGGKLGGDHLLASGTARFNGQVSASWTGEAYLVAWSDSRDGNWEIYTSAVAADGTLLTGLNRVSAAGGQSLHPVIAGDGVARLAAWGDTRDGNWEIYAAPLSPSGERSGPEVRVTTDGATSTRPSVAWDGSRFLVVWADNRTGRNEAWARLLDAGGTPMGSELQLTLGGGSRPHVVSTPTGWAVDFLGLGGFALVELDPTGAPIGPAHLIAAVGAGSRSEDYGTVGWDGNQLVAAFGAGLYWTSEAYLTSVACTADDTPPTCPDNLAGEPIGVNVTLSWSPGGDPDFAADWQKVYRDNLLVAALSPEATGWTDPMPTPGAHTYRVTTLNQGRVESTGCAEIAVYASATCVATRDLPDVYGGGTPFAVTVSTVLPPSASTHAVEDAPPAGWAVSNISDGGSWDPGQGRVKWVFFDNLSRNLTYTVTPPAGTTGTFVFSGVVSVDGGSQAICGDGEVGSGPPHPADVNDDWRMVINEVTGYATAWRTGQTWPEPPNPIPIAYVTNAAYLYLSGEVYHYVLGASPPYAPGTESLPVGDGTAWSTFGAMSWAPATPFAVTVQVTPDAATLAWAAEDEPPVGWTVSGISHGGVFDAVNHKVKWGPFLDHTPRALQYTITPTAGSGLRSFAGTASFDGHDVPLAGARAIGRVLGDVDADDDLDRDDHVALRLDLYGVAPAPLPDIDKDGQVDARDLSEEVKALEVVLP